MTLYLFERWIMHRLSNLFIRPPESPLSTTGGRNPEDILNRIRMNDARLDVLETRTEALERAQALAESQKRRVRPV